MTQKELGYVELEWTCKRCGTKNPGLQKTCTNCGAPMETGEQFEAPAQQELITDKEKLEAAKSGADIHCPYCGTRNPAGTQACIQCGGDLKQGTAREAGQVVGAFQSAPVPEIACPFCQAKIKADAQRCPNCGGDLRKQVAPPPAPAAAKKMPLWLMILLGILLLACCGGAVGLALLNAKTEDVRGRVDGVAWQLSVAVQEERPSRKSAWQENVPAGAEDVSCKDQYRETLSQPAPKSTEVCGTPYTIDQGSGAGKVVQDCQYQVYDNYCDYTVLEWQNVDTLTAQGQDVRPVWPNLSLAAGQREGGRSETYVVYFSADGTRYEYPVGNAADFARFIPGSEWTLKINTFGTLNSVEP
jgi:hypothetical protein